jgi:hypothetical protein
MSCDDELPLIAAALASGIISASVPMTPDDAVVVYNRVKDALQRQAQIEGVPILGTPRLSAQHRAHDQNGRYATRSADRGLSDIRQAAD